MIIIIHLSPCTCHDACDKKKKEKCTNFLPSKAMIMLRLTVCHAYTQAKFRGSYEPWCCTKVSLATNKLIPVDLDEV